MDSQNPTRWVLALVAAAALIFLKSVRNGSPRRSRTMGLPLPPGPRGLPIVGNYFDIPSAHAWPWLRYWEMSKRYGDMIYFHTMGQRVLVLNNSTAAYELLDKRAANYSDRPKTPIWESLGGTWFLSMIPYGTWWRSHRREFWQQFNPSMLGKYDPIQQQEVHKFLNALLDNPAHVKKQLRFVFGATILRIVYNIKIESVDDPIIAALDEGNAGFAEGLIPRSSLLEYFPLLKFWPPIKSRLARYDAVAQSMRDLPYAAAQERPDDSGYTSVIVAMQERLSQLGQEYMAHDEEIIRNVAGVSYSGGGETGYSAMQTFFLAMSLYPEVQKKAQAELDAQVGRDRLPDVNDREKLPYINAVMKESLRWQNVTPLGVSHVSLDDDVYNGYFIPAGTIVLPNVWAMLHDPAVYNDPMEFRPERFLKDGGLGPPAPDPLVAFGFGRRLCPGRHSAERFMFILIASILSAFELSPPLDDAGRPIRIEPKQTSGELSYPVDCRCTVTPRSEAAVALVRHISLRDEVGE